MREMICSRKAAGGDGISYNTPSRRTRTRNKLSKGSRCMSEACNSNPLSNN